MDQQSTKLNGNATWDLVATQTWNGNTIKVLKASKIYSDLHGEKRRPKVPHQWLDTRLVQATG